MENAENKTLKKLPPSVVKDLELKNYARKMAGLSLIKIKVRTCLSCGSLFESAGNFTCGCQNGRDYSVAGRDIL
jgi:hypothetical protein